MPVYSTDIEWRDQAALSSLFFSVRPDWVQFLDIPGLTRTDHAGYVRAEHCGTRDIARLWLSVESEMWSWTQQHNRPVMMDTWSKKLKIFFDSLSIDHFYMWWIIFDSFHLVPQSLYSLLSRNRWWHKCHKRYNNKISPFYCLNNKYQICASILDEKMLWWIIKTLYSLNELRAGVLLDLERATFFFLMSEKSS